VRSANPRLAIPLIAGLSFTLAGCVSTQTRNARLVIENERTVDSQAPVRVTRLNPQVAVTGVHLIRVSGGAAVAVSLHNLASHPLSDLPISTGIAGRNGTRYYLNRKANLNYFDTHVAALGAGAVTTWVLPLRRISLPRGRLFAAVGFAKIPASTTARTLPTIDASIVVAAAAAAAGARARAGGRAGAKAGDGLEIAVENRSAVPQMRLPVYAVATKAGRFVGAGRATVAELSGGERRTLRLQLLGTSTGARLELFVPPTIFN
jgi:hypothetical protein